MAKPKPPETDAELTEIEQQPEKHPAEPVETDSNDEPEADANGDGDDECEDENEAVRKAP